jgi:hypothetical protein
MFAGQKIIQDNIMNRRRAKALDDLIMNVVKDMKVLYINVLYERLPDIDKQRIRSCLKRHGYTFVSTYTMEKRDGKKQVGKTSNSKR